MAKKKKKAQPERVLIRSLSEKEMATMSGGKEAGDMYGSQKNDGTPVQYFTNAGDTVTDANYLGENGLCNYMVSDGHLGGS